MKNYLIFVFTLATISDSLGQDIIEWNQTYKLERSDFLARTGESTSGVFTVHAACAINFFYQMSSYEFMLTKNFNSKASTTFNRPASYILAPDSITGARLLRFAQAEFDLAELYARKFRKSMFDNKKAFSDPGFYQRLYDSIQKEHTVHVSQLSQNTEIGMAENRLNEQHQQIIADIESLSDYCKSCKPKKKKKEI